MLSFGHFRSRESVNISSKVQVVLARNVTQMVQQKINYYGPLILKQNLRINGLVLRFISHIYLGAKELPHRGNLLTITAFEGHLLLSPLMVNAAADASHL